MLRLATRAPGLSDPPSMKKVYRRGEGAPDRETDARRRVLEVLEEYGGLAFTLKELSETAGSDLFGGERVGETGGCARRGHAARPAVSPAGSRLWSGKALTEDQAAAAERFCARGWRSERYGTTLLRGVTGSGKTEVYLEAVAECLRMGRQALVLLPEIALTARNSWTRVEARFGCKAAEWHSGVTMTERRRIWKMAGQGARRLVVGARSALFLPYQNLGLIVVDEEHDTSYKQEDGVLYNARDMAVLRASICGRAGGAGLGHALALKAGPMRRPGKYERLDLTARFGRGGACRRCGDRYARRRAASGTLDFAQPAAGRSRRGWKRASRALLFINRRGYAPVTICAGPAGIRSAVTIVTRGWSSTGSSSG